MSFQANDDNKTKSLYVILSGERPECRPKSNFCGLSEANKQEAKNTSCLSGIWLKISVACQRECYICCGKPPNLQAISHRRYRSSVLPRSSLGKTSTPKTASRFSPLRMTYRSFICDYLLFFPNSTAGCITSRKTSYCIEGCYVL